MATISENLQAIRNAKSDIKQAIESKGQSLDNVPFTQYAQKINAIQAGGEKDMLQYRVDNINSCEYLFCPFQGTSLDISRLDTSNVTDMASMFYQCRNLTSLDVSNLNTSKVTDMMQMFRECSSLTSLDVSNFNTSNVKKMTFMFMECKKLLSLDLSNFNTSNVANLNFMFSDCNQLTSVNVGNFNTSNATDMSYMFRNCQNLTSLDVSNFNTSKATRMDYMFYGCSQLTSLDVSNFDTGNATNMGYMFRDCVNLTYLKIGNPDLKKVGSNSTYMFYGCKKLETIDGEIDVYSVTSLANWFVNCTNLTNLPRLKNIRVYLQIGSGTSWGHLITVDSLVNIIKELWDKSSETATNITFGTANKAKIANVYVKLITPTAEQIEADPYINNKLPCELCESTDEGAMLIEDYANLKNWTLL